jgi:hypothetical protein
MTGLQIVHWFNPILWLGFRRMAADRELACDELALSAVGETDGLAYGQTIVKLLETCSQIPTLSGLVGILEDKSQIFHRVSMIARFKRRPRWSIVGGTALAALGLTTLTGAQTEQTNELTTTGQAAQFTIRTNTMVPPCVDPAKWGPYDLGSLKVRLEGPSTPSVADQIIRADGNDVSVEVPSTKSAAKLLQAGVDAPGFTTTTLDGKPLLLAAYRGKFVLVDFRYMLPGFEMEGLEAVDKKFGKDDRFVIVSLCQNANDEYVQERKSQGDTHWLMGDLDFSTMGDSYGLSKARFPLILLVGPDGKIIASQLHGEDIYTAVAHALGKN